MVAFSSFKRNKSCLQQVYQVPDSVIGPIVAAPATGYLFVTEQYLFERTIFNGLIRLDRQAVGFR